ncbi:MAG: YdcH family protein [Alphaproteobacteria bacterium]|nr:YdcH family protein [Alphaproteobacteria bacterium]MDE2514241.1 YdcH family protein [Alphaproteobacteria bacterium]
MTLEDRIEELRTRHRSLEDQINRESHRPLPNIESLSTLKRQKLRIKDELTQLEHAH